MDNTETPLSLAETLRLRIYRLKVMKGELSDWPKFHHAVSMTCGNFQKERHWLAPWYVQLASILAHKNVLLDDGKTV